MQQRKMKKGRFHAYTIVEEESSQKNAPKEKEIRRQCYLVLALSGYIITSENTWLIENGASKNMSGNKGSISDLRRKSSHAW